MKKSIILIISIFFISFSGFTQLIDSIAYISPFHEGLASVNKGGEWAFINENGTIIIAFRNDLVSVKINENSYPYFNNGRCLIQRTKENITYFGYIDETGDVVIEPQFISATNFNYGHAIVLELTKINLGHNSVLDKPMVSYKYQEVVIDSLGNIKSYLAPQYPVSFTDYTKIKPHVNSRIISKYLIIVEGVDKKLALKKIE